MVIPSGGIFSRISEGSMPPDPAGEPGDAANGINIRGVLS